VLALMPDGLMVCVAETQDTQAAMVAAQAVEDTLGRILGDLRSSVPRPSA